MLERPDPSDRPESERRKTAALPSAQTSEGRLLAFMRPEVRTSLTPEQRAEVLAAVVRALEEDPRVVDELYMNRLDARYSGARYSGLRRVLARLGWRFKLMFGGVVLKLFVQGDRRRLNRWVDRAFALLVVLGMALGYFFLAYLIKRNILGIDIIPDFHLWQ